ncbi:MAG: NYN domain-containing protein [Candidatus Zambryskibacteria bacterium]
MKLIHCLKIENKSVKKKLGIFIDGANMYYASKQAGWKLDLGKIKKLFNSIFDVKIFNYYAALPDKTDKSYANSKKYLSIVEEFAKVITKPLKYINGEKKGNVDIEITLDVVRNLNDLDEIIIFTGDSDYFELWKYVFGEKGKRIRFASFRDNLAFELKRTKYLILEKIREFIELNGQKNTPDLTAGRTSVLAIIDDDNLLSSGGGDKN